MSCSFIVQLIEEVGEIKHPSRRHLKVQVASGQMSFLLPIGNAFFENGGQASGNKSHLPCDADPDSFANSVCNFFKPMSA
jgi:hypothetical protein